jgi:hypothetical protein
MLLYKSKQFVNAIANLMRLMDGRNCPPQGTPQKKRPTGNPASALCRHYVLNGKVGDLTIGDLPLPVQADNSDFWPLNEDLRSGRQAPERQPYAVIEESNDVIPCFRRPPPPFVQRLTKRPLSGVDHVDKPAKHTSALRCGVPTVKDVGVVPQPFCPKVIAERLQSAPVR